MTGAKADRKQVEMMRERGFVTAREAAERGGIARTSIYRWCREKRLDVEHIGGTVYVMVDGDRGLKKILGPLWDSPAPRRRSRPLG